MDIRLGDSSSDEWNWSRGALISYYGTTAVSGWDPFANSTDNNGNVLRQVNYVPLSGGGYVIPQLDDYTYDALNPIASVTEAQQNSSGTWSYNVTSQTFTYDRWGNRTSVTGQTAQSWSTTEAAATNRLKLTSGNVCTGTKVGLCYDAAGNLTFDNQLGSGGDRTYDAEGRIITASGGGTNKYVYDADGKRVRRQVGATQYWQVYGIGGELVAEYQWNGTTATLQKEYGYGGEVSVVAENAATVWWLVKDHLGTPRMLADQTGSLGGMRRHDYYPFGEENFAGSLIRTTTNGYQAEGVRQKFTGYERDTETNLDYAQARYYAYLQGRFTSVDPAHSSGEPGEPQSWNRYSYVGNRPLSYTDPSGLLWAFHDGRNEYQWFEDGLSEKDKADGWKVVTNFTFYGGDWQYIALNPLKNEWRAGFATRYDAQSSVNLMLSQTDEPKSYTTYDGAGEMSIYVGGAGGAFNILKAGLSRMFASEIEQALVTVTHRGMAESIAAKMETGVLPANYPIPNNTITRFLDHSNPAVWVTEGEPTILNKMLSGMVGRRGEASITFEIEKSQLKSPDGVKRIFGPFQRVIEQDVSIPTDARISLPVRTGQ